MPKPEIIFHLKQPFYKAILDGVKDVEYRDRTPYWMRRVKGLKVPFPVWFVSGYPKDNLPRIESEVHLIYVNPYQVEFHFRNTREVSSDAGQKKML